MKNHHFLTSMILFMISNLVYAEQYQPDGSWYVQGSIGYSVTDTDNMIDENTYDINDDDIGYEIAVGYLFTDYVGIKLGWRDLGEMSYKSSNSYTPSEHSAHFQSARALFVALTGQYPVTEKFALTGSIGFSRLSIKNEYNNYINDILDSSDHFEADLTEPYFSVGAQYHVNRNVALTSEFIHQPILNLMTINSYQLGIKYKF